MIEGLDAILSDFHIQTQHPELYEMAFTHRSYTNEHPECPCYDRLEFLGDSILDMVVGRLVFDHFPKDNSGVLSKARAALVDGKTLMRLSESVYGFASLVRYSQGERNNTAHHGHINEDVFEAFLGAVYLDQGFIFVEKIIIDICTPLLPIALEVSAQRDSKGKLQEYLHGCPVQYVVVSSSGVGTDDVSFTVEARLGKNVLGVGTGHNTKEAEVNSAKDALRKKVGN